MHPPTKHRMAPTWKCSLLQVLSFSSTEEELFMNWFKNALETLVLDLDWIIFCMVLCSTGFVASQKSLNLCCP
jgi:hypothetical protein